jgi:hypothetical protein
VAPTVNIGQSNSPGRLDKTVRAKPGPLCLANFKVLNLKFTNQECTVRHYFTIVVTHTPFNINRTFFATVAIGANDLNSSKERYIDIKRKVALIGANRQIIMLEQSLAWPTLPGQLTVLNLKFKCNNGKFKCNNG